MDPWEIDNVYVESARLQVKATRTSIGNLRSTMEESRRILARSQELLRRIHQKESSAQTETLLRRGNRLTEGGGR